MSNSDNRDRKQSTDYMNPHEADLLDKNVISQLLSLENGSTFLSDLVQTFIRDGNALLMKLDIASKDDYSTFRNTMHALKGNAGNIGATSLYTECKAAEYMSLLEYQSQAAERIKSIRDNFKRTIFILNQVSLQ